MNPEPLAIEPLTTAPDVTLRVPGSKSLTNRALLAAALARGTSELTGVLDADDTAAMLDVVRALGAGVEGDPAAGAVRVTGVAGALPASAVRLDARQSGTTGRFALGVTAAGRAPITVDGAVQLRSRPMTEGIRVLRSLGLDVREDGAAGHLPVTVTRGPAPGGALAVRADVSSQFLSGMLLVAPCLDAGLDLTIDGPVVSRPYLTLTVDVLEAFGASVAVRDDGFTVAPGGYTAAPYAVEGDASAASYFFAAAAVTGGRVRIEGLGTTSHQGDLAMVEVLAAMGADVTQGPDWTEVRGTGALRAVDVDLRDLSDTVPTLAVVAACAEGTTTLDGIGFIRAKESDRIGAVVAQLRACGVDATETPDGMRIVGGGRTPATIATHDDHRLAMAFSVLGLVSPGIVIDDPGCVAKSFPGFFALLDELR
ncbi:MAG: 3-phosphoshikimate 1-carboxyvinyltransferase [Acidimicrobiales bacterium]|nr:3-phosphoshikimate 1-carboxyvinyltransferase [Acidimicrobiales bacterium]MCB1261017.1 3-phosphoshikimate 1-carboxyvinyltransferase [Acidimicrobiales bacterium]